jgi:hypothetical protein
MSAGAASHFLPGIGTASPHKAVSDFFVRRL